MFMDKHKLGDEAMPINYARLVLLKRWCFSMRLEMSMEDASLIFCGRLFHNLRPKYQKRRLRGIEGNEKADHEAKRD